MRIMVWLSAALLAASAPVSAQTTFVTAEITGGTVNVDLSRGFLDTTIDLTGPGIHIVSARIEEGVLNACPDFGCRPGETFTLSANYSGTYMGDGMAVVNGVTINPAYYGGTLYIRTDEVTIPRGNRKRLVLSVPFTLEGPAAQPGATLGIYPTSFKDVLPMFVVTLSGGGTATAFFERVHYKDKGFNAFFYDLVKVTYSFHTPATAP